MSKGQLKDLRTMGMAASQARLLSITARIHDVEYEAQAIQNAKIQLSTHEDQVYREYQDALDATTLTMTAIDVENGQKSTLTANFTNMFSINRARPATDRNYLLLDSRGRVVVDEDIYNGYANFMAEGWEKTPYAFAMYMMGGYMLSDAGYLSTQHAFCSIENSIYVNNEEDDEVLKNLKEAVLRLNGTAPSDWNYVDAIYDTNNMPPENKEDYERALQAYLNYLYKHYGEDIFSAMNAVILQQNPNADVQDYDRDKYNYYIQIFNAIQQAGECISIEDFDGPSGDAANNSEWLTNMIQSGLMTIEVIDVNKKSGEFTLTGDTVSADPNLAFTTTTDIDKAALAKAEAKYEHEMKLINRKDKEFDLSLSKLETERNALTTEYESAKKVIEDNIKRTFGIFS